MTDNGALLEPLDYYGKIARDSHSETVKSYFESLVQKSGIDVEENKKTVKLYNEEATLVEGLKKQLKKYRIIRGVLIALATAGMLLFAFGVVAENSVWVTVLTLILGVAIITFALVLVFTKNKRDIAGLKGQVNDHHIVAQKILDSAYAQMATMNSLFSDYDAYNLTEKTLPQFKFNRYYSRENEVRFLNGYGFSNYLDDSCSVVDALSGTFCDNPFLYFRYKQQSWIDELYSGSMTIYWTETYKDSQGNTRTRSRSQVLTATVSKPKPHYTYHTALAYGNQYGDKLNFTRQAQHWERFDEKKIESKVKSGEKKLEAKARKAIEGNGTFQEMSNTKFDVLFGATDRDNEVQFRTMFTPLAQTNMVDLLTDKNNYGDDFNFSKRGKCNIIESEHSQRWAMEVYANNYTSYSLEDSYTKFVTLNNEFLKSLYFDFAPFMAIPAYMDSPSFSLDEIDNYDTNYTCYEYESLANVMGQSNFASDRAVTDTILKATCVGKKDGTDIVSIVANSYEGYDRVDYVPKLGGDGNMHSVPVPWVEYSPIETEQNITVSLAKEEDREEQDENVIFATFHTLIGKMFI